jgi:hypothetical protein
MYESPITIYQKHLTTEITEGIDNAALKAVWEYGVDVNKEELLKALADDRGQWEKGYTVGYERAKYETAMEIKRALLDMCDAPHWCVWMSDISRFFEEMYEKKED